ncbi:MAG: site-specific DNA-methyltransferase [Clostridium argentinense]|nr:site-specific DNA-methyltransferase [Clostridium argentinense]
MENKVTKEIFSPINENIKKLESLFPEIVKDGQVDFEALKQELGQFEEVGKEKYELTWPGKTQAKQLANTDIVGKTLKYVPEDSKNPETTENLYIEGDNLEVLKLLRNSYYGKVKMIYIDPPYNTGNDFVYKDNFAMEVTENEKIEGNIDEEGNRLIKNQEGSGRFHSNWLNMMYPRLKIAKDLLKEDGVIFISIDDNEVENLKKVCNEIFNEKNFVGEIIRKTKSMTADNGNGFNLQHENLMIYAKNKMNVYLLGKEKEFENYSNPDNDPNGDWCSGDPSAKSGGDTTYFPIVNPYTNKVDYPPKGRYWAFSQSTLKNYIERGKIKFKKDYKENERGFIFKRYKNEAMNPYNPVNSLFAIENEFMNQNATTELKELFAESIFSYPKPIAYLYELIKCSANDDSDIILDFFAGSGTTAHAVIQLNAEDGGNRKFIMVQIPEPCDEKSEAYKAGYKNICEIGKERIRRAGEKIKEEFKDKEGIEKLDVGFKVFRVDGTNIRWNNEALKEGQITIEESTLKNKDLIDFNHGFTDIDVVYEIILRHRDFPLTSKIEKLSNIGERTYIFADAIVVCLEEKVTDKIVDGIAAIEPKPIKVIFRDSAFEDDISLKINTMNRLDAQLKKHNQGKEQSYRVEFI